MVLALMLLQWQGWLRVSPLWLGRKAGQMWRAVLRALRSMLGERLPLPLVLPAAGRGGF